MQSEIYTGRVSGMKMSPWIASEDILGMPSPELTISAVIRNTNVEMDGGRTEPVLYSVQFAGSPKSMILNSTNRQALSTAFGADTRHWIGQKVTLYVQDGIRKPGGKKGETTTGLRIRAKAAPPKPFSMPSKSAAVDGGGSGRHEKPTTSDETSPVPHPEPTEAAQARAEQS